ncbi:hypothetical protein F5Y04DRAFT_263932 [Hypomontagnella monticulosa]|nr:hypothetical protein F5Y04DRAFT_263932 [Hypomontagnella monticulosa]
MSGLEALAAVLPECAAACMLTAVGASSCAVSNQTCLCHDQAFNTKATVCITANCTIREAFFTKNLTSTSCGIEPTVDHSFYPVFITFLILAAISLLLRIIARFQARLPMWWDDFFITLPFLGCICFMVIVIIITPRGFGTDIWAIHFDDITFIFKAMYAIFVLYSTCRQLVRLSILFFYHRILGRIPLAKRLIQYTFALIIGCCVAFDFAIIFACTPVDYFWTRWDGEHEGHCININALLWAGGIIALVVDIWVILIPIPFIMRLKLSARKKILAALMFAFGVFVLIISIYRLTTINYFTLSQNPTLDFVKTGTWGGLEIFVGIICACLPNFHSLLRPVYGWIGLSSLKPKTYATGKSGNSSHHHSRMHDTKSGIRATTTITVNAEQSPSESQEHLSRPYRGDTGGSVEIELGTRSKGWS